MRFFALALLFLPLLTTAQVDLGAIKSEVINSTSSRYYPSLLKRFQSSDSTLTFQDFQFLYYGFTTQPAYKPKSVDTLEVESKERNKAQNYIGAYELCDTILALYPMSIGAYFEKSFACYHLRRTEEEQYNRKRYQVLIRTVLKSGDGTSAESPYSVISYNDMYEVTDYLQLNIEKEDRIEYAGLTYFLLTPSKNKSKITQLYFYCTDPRALDK